MKNIKPTKSLATIIDISNKKYAYTKSFSNLTNDEKRKAYNNYWLMNMSK